MCFTGRTYFIKTQRYLRTTYHLYLKFILKKNEKLQALTFKEIGFVYITQAFQQKVDNPIFSIVLYPISQYIPDNSKLAYFSFAIHGPKYYNPFINNNLTNYWQSITKSGYRDGFTKFSMY